MSDQPPGEEFLRGDPEAMPWPLLPQWENVERQEPPEGVVPETFGTAQYPYEITLYNSQGEAWSNTFNGWRFDVMRPSEALMRDYGMDNLDIMRQLQQFGYANRYVSARDGAVGVDAFWRDWRDAYASVWGV